MRATVTLSLFALGVACTRTEEPQNARAAETALPAPPAPVAPAAPSATAPSIQAAAASAAPVASVAPAAPRCVVPMAEPALPQQKPALDCPKDSGFAPKLDLGTVSFAEAKPAVKLAVERARLPSEHSRGLMFRTQMPEDHGMIFEWPEESRRVFWMHNTCIPLDMLFIARDGTVAGILEQVPVLNDAPRTVPCDASYVLEVNAGWCRRHGVKPGMRAKLW